MNDIKIENVLFKETTVLDIDTFPDKDSLFQYLSGVLFESGNITSQGLFLKALYEREEEGSTYMGEEIAVPHGKSDAVTTPCVAICRVQTPFDYVSNDEVGPVRLVFMLAVPSSGASTLHLSMLAKLSRMLVHEEFIAQLSQARNFSEVLQAFQDCEASL